MIKYCFGCKIEKNLDYFSNNKSNKEGKSNYCKSCKKEIDLISREKNKKSILEKSKSKRNKTDIILNQIRKSKGNKCIKCNENREHLLDFHHINKKDKINDAPRMLFLGGFKEENLIKVRIEANKCILLCSNCHRDFHHLERKNNINIEDYLGR